jgi:hypothetical protein
LYSNRYCDCFSCCITVFEIINQTIIKAMINWITFFLLHIEIAKWSCFQFATVKADFTYSILYSEISKLRKSYCVKCSPIHETAIAYQFPGDPQSLCILCLLSTFKALKIHLIKKLLPPSVPIPKLMPYTRRTAAVTF